MQPRRPTEGPFAPGALRLSARDAAILTLTRAKLAGTDPRLDDAVRALADAVGETIPAGRVYLLGHTDDGPALGSLISGVGIASLGGVVTVVRLGADGRLRALLPLVGA